MFEDCSKTTEWNLASAKDQIPYIDPNVASFMTLKGPNLNRVGFVLFFKGQLLKPFVHTQKRLHIELQHLLCSS